jgi:hypothetical protein
MPEEIETMGEAFALLADQIRYDHVLESAWRWFRRNSDRAIPLSDIVDRVMAKCPGLGRDDCTSDVRKFVERRLARTRFRGATGLQSRQDP